MKQSIRQWLGDYSSPSRIETLEFSLELSSGLPTRARNRALNTDLEKLQYDDLSIFSFDSVRFTIKALVPLVSVANVLFLSDPPGGEERTTQPYCGWVGYRYFN